jgi:hypothetical protein
MLMITFFIITTIKHGKLLCGSFIYTDYLMLKSNEEFIEQFFFCSFISFVQNDF